MTDEELGRLTRMKGETTREIENLKKRLQQMGATLHRVGNELQRAPENMVFANAPGQIGSFPPHLLGTPGINWDEIPSKTDYGQLIQDLRSKIDDLRDINRRLAEA